ncbi:HDOD domain-containing protein [Myxococcota bacterium]|nr:HDOD domain-containing protein [Myxococcota bacterium]MBU1431431.1 HDOD domain-containing protein [Myxococcota bacterium]MBU1898873.1 HDOD domain-containing protein [Myxococcota bacterium]
MTRIKHRGVVVALPEGEGVERLLDELEEGALGHQLLGHLGAPTQARLRRLFLALYAAGARDGINRALELGVDPEGTPAEVAPPPSVEAAPRSAIQRVIARAQRGPLKLPQPPETGAQVNRILADPDYDVSKLVEVVKRDPALSAKLMALGASPFFMGRGRPPRTLNDAIMRVGSRELSKFLMTECNQQLFNFSTMRRKGAIKALWVHSLITASLSEQIAYELEAPNPPSYFLHGLLHDIGKAVLYQILSDEEDDLPEDEVMTIIDSLHGRFGATLLTKWRFDKTFLDVATQHHDPQPHGGLVGVVQLANQLAYALLEPDEAPLPEAAQPYARFLGLNEDALKRTQHLARRSFEALSAAR